MFRLNLYIGYIHKHKGKFDFNPNLEHISQKSQTEKEKFFSEWLHRNNIDISNFEEKELQEESNGVDKQTNIVENSGNGILAKIKNMFKKITTKKLPVPQEVISNNGIKTSKQKHDEFVAELGENIDTAQALKKASSGRSTVIDKEKTH